LDEEAVETKPKSKKTPKKPISNQAKSESGKLIYWKKKYSELANFKLILLFEKRAKMMRLL